MAGEAIAPASSAYPETYGAVCIVTTSGPMADWPEVPVGHVTDSGPLTFTRSMLGSTCVLLGQQCSELFPHGSYLGNVLPWTRESRDLG